jgi:hypothetical protein
MFEQDSLREDFSKNGHTNRNRGNALRWPPEYDADPLNWPESLDRREERSKTMNVVVKEMPEFLEYL